MTEPTTQPLSPEEVRREEFDVRTLADEIRVDALCARLLQAFARDLAERQQVPPVTAGALAHGADYFLREFVVADRRENIFALRPDRVRQFAANWYIVRTLEPNLTELGAILAGILAFYEYCQDRGLVSPELTTRIRKDSQETGFYRQRIEDFLNLEGDGYLAWEAACSLKD